MTEPSGVWAPALTPFDASLEPDVPRWIAHCKRLLASGCSGLAIFGTTSEANSLSVDERERMLDALLASGVPAQKLLPGTGCAALPDTVRLTKKAMQAGCAGVLVLPPFYYKNVSDDALFRSYAAVLDRTGPARIYLYHIPQVSAVPITLSLIRRLREAFPQQVVGMKDSSGSWENTKSVLEGAPGFRVFVGSERFLLANMRKGGVGCITATANVNAKMIDALYQSWREPDAQAKQDAIDRVRDVFEKFGAIPAMKAVLGFGDLRPPLMALGAEQKAQLEAALREVGFSPAA